MCSGCGLFSSILSSATAQIKTSGGDPKALEAALKAVTDMAESAAPVPPPPPEAAPRLLPRPHPHLVRELVCVCVCVHACICTGDYVFCLHILLLLSIRWSPPPPPPPPGIGGGPLRHHPFPGGPPGPPPPPPGFGGSMMAVKLPPGLKPKKKYKVDMQMRRMNWVQVCMFVCTYVRTSGKKGLLCC